MSQDSPDKSAKNASEPSPAQDKPTSDSFQTGSDEAKNKKEDFDTANVAPKSTLTPYLLLLLREQLHGYALWERLVAMGIPGLQPSDRATIYRMLRQLEEDGKITSSWDTTENHGPARRVYSLTDAGESWLKVWADGLEQYRKSLDFFFNMYSGGFFPNPFTAFNGPDQNHPTGRNPKDTRK